MQTAVSGLSLVDDKNNLGTGTVQLGLRALGSEAITAGAVAAEGITATFTPSSVKVTNTASAGESTLTLTAGANAQSGEILVCASDAQGQSCVGVNVTVQ